jgi:hypothetical protein
MLYMSTGPNQHAGSGVNSRNHTSKNSSSSSSSSTAVASTSSSVSTCIIGDIGGGPGEADTLTLDDR